MEEFNYDGEVHLLDHENYYVIKRIFPEQEQNIQNISLELYQKYAEFLVDNDPEKCVEYLMEIFKYRLIHQIPNRNVKLVYRAPEMASPLCTHATLAIVFKGVNVKPEDKRLVMGKELNCHHGYFELPSQILEVKLDDDRITFYCEDGVYEGTMDDDEKIHLKKVSV